MHFYLHKSTKSSTFAVNLAKTGSDSQTLHAVQPNTKD